MSLREYLSESADVLRLAAQVWSEDLLAGAAAAVLSALRAGKPVLVCGNGGSSADAMHLTGELVGRFMLERRAINAICLSSNMAAISAWANDLSFDAVFSRQVEAHGAPGAVLIGLSTSGNSRNVVAAFEQARAMDMRTIALTGEGGGRLAPLSDYLFTVPSRSTPLIQQAHVCLCHHLCGVIEREFAAGGPR